MKRVILIWIILTNISLTFAQWTSPGAGNTYTLSEISNVAPNAVATESSNKFVITQDITISDKDSLVIENSIDTITVADNVTIIINGSLITDMRDNKLIFSGLKNTSNPFNLRFDGASACILKNTTFFYCERILLIDSEITIDSCEFSKFSNHVISYMNCNPIIKNCDFHDNNACAIQSAINTEGSPKILNNRFYNNVINNTNNPQINIGPGATDTILIIGNHIEGFASNMSGGIAIANLYNPDTTNVIVENNVIKNNRYGYTQNGYRINSLIRNNIIIDNNLEINPNNGGSGISIFGYDTTCASKIRNNLISGNLWGITAIYYNNIDLGNTDDYGENIIYDNGNNNIEYALFNNSNNDIQAVGNYWGHADEQSVEDVIFHKADSAVYGLVNYEPFNVLEPFISAFSFLKSDNPSLEQNYEGTFSSDSDTIYVEISTNDESILQVLRPQITKPQWVSINPNSSDPQNFSTPVTYTAYSPHQSSREYVVVANITLSVDDFSNAVYIFPNPVIDNKFYINNTHSETIKWTLLSQDGKIVKIGDAEQGISILETHNLSEGIYFLKYHFGKTDYYKKIIIR